MRACSGFRNTRAKDVLVSNEIRQGSPVSNCFALLRFCVLHSNLAYTCYMEYSM